MKEVEMFNNGVGDHPLCPLNHSSVEGGGSTTATPTQKHERLNTLTYEEGLQQAQLHIKILFGWCVFLSLILVFLLRKVVFGTTSRLQQMSSS
jgi:hypothetical protein